jgi:integrase
MSVKKRPDRNLWRVSWREPSTNKVCSKCFATEAEAVAYDYRIKALKAEKSPVLDPSTCGVTFAELALKFYSTRAGQMAAHTVESDVFNLRSHIIPTLGAIQADKLTRQDFDKLAEVFRARGNKQNTIRRKFVIVKAVLAWAVEHEYIKDNPAKGYRVSAGEDAVIMPPTRQEIEAILAHADGYLLRAILLTFHFGLRPGASELLRLRWIDVDLADGVARVMSAKKGGGKWREIPIPPHLVTIMAHWHAEDGGSGYIIHHPTGRSLGRVLEAWIEAKRKAGITRRIRMYDLRHAFATIALGAGADLKSVSEIMGHASPSLTLKTYQHALSKNKRHAVNLLPTLGQHSGTTNGANKPILTQPTDNKIQ